MKWSRTEKILIPLAVILAVIAGVLIFAPSRTVQRKGALASRGNESHEQATDPTRVPTFQTDAASLNDLPPTLPPDKFFGKTREAYIAVREIPRTIAQLPCYCYCDEAHGHKSLHSCFVDNHASQCAVCVDEALMAYRLAKGQQMAPSKIRELIVAKYSSQQ